MESSFFGCSSCFCSLGLFVCFFFSFHIMGFVVSLLYFMIMKLSWLDRVWFFLVVTGYCMVIFQLFGNAI